MVKIIIMEMACWENCGETIPFFFLSCFLFLNAVDKGMGQWTKHASQKSEFSPRLCGDGLRSSRWSLWVSVSSSVKWRGGACLPSGPPVPSRTSASTWEKLPGGKVSLSWGKRVPSKSKLLFCWPKEFLCKKHFKWV